MPGSFLVSADFRASNGGIPRVAHLVHGSLPFDRVFSLHGEPDGSGATAWFGGSKARFVRAVAAELRRRRPELVVSDHLGLSSLFGYLPRSWYGRLVTWLYDVESWRPVRGRHRHGLERSERLLCISRHTLRLFTAANPRYAGKARVCLLGGVPPAFAAAGPDPAFPARPWFRDPRPFLLMVSRFRRVHRYKGHLELIEAFARYRRLRPRAPLRLALVGRGDDVPEIRERIAERGLTGVAEVFTDVNDAELAAFYRACTAFLFPSAGEGFGLVLLEAMYFGKPCIGLLGQPAEEIVVHDETGRLLPGNDPEHLLAAILDVEADPERYRRYGLAGRKRFDETFTTEAFRRRFLEALGPVPAAGVAGAA